jgi:hypothetical protein
VSTVNASLDDDELLAALRRAMLEREDVPAEFVEAGKNAFAWHDIDAELARLTYDSVRDSEPALSMRSESASIRALTFTSAHLSIELEVGADSLVGQVVPTQAATIKVQRRVGTELFVPADEIGCFSIRPVPAGEFRLHCRTAQGVDAQTGWITL